MGCFEVLLKVGVRDDHCDVTIRSKIKSTTLRQTQPRWLKTAIGPLTVKSILMNRKDNFNSVCSFRATAKCRPFRWTLNNVQTLCRVHHPLYFGALMFGDEHRQTSLLGFPSEQTFVNSLICKEPTKVIARNPLPLRTTANRSNPPPLSHHQTSRTLSSTAFISFPHLSHWSPRASSKLHKGQVPSTNLNEKTSMVFVLRSCNSKVT